MSDPNLTESDPKPAHWAAIGAAVTTWSELEFAIDRAVWHLLDVDQNLGACLTAQFPSVFSRLSALSALAGVRMISKEKVDELNRFRGKLGSLSEKRNRIVHDPRYIMENLEIHRLEVTTKGSLRFELEPETLGALDLFRAEVVQKMNEFLQIWTSILEEFESTAGKTRLRTPRLLLDVPGQQDPPTTAQEK